MILVNGEYRLDHPVWSALPLGPWHLRLSMETPINNLQFSVWQSQSGAMLHILIRGGAGEVSAVNNRDCQRSPAGLDIIPPSLGPPANDMRNTIELRSQVGGIY